MSNFCVRMRQKKNYFMFNPPLQYANYAINNDGTLDDLHKEIDRLVSEKGLPVI